MWAQVVLDVGSTCEDDGCCQMVIFSVWWLWLICGLMWWLKLSYSILKEEISCHHTMVVSDDRGGVGLGYCFALEDDLLWKDNVPLKRKSTSAVEASIYIFINVEFQTNFLCISIWPGTVVPGRKPKDLGPQVLFPYLLFLSLENKIGFLKQTAG